MAQQQYAPLLRGLWKLGLKIPPLPFMSFRHVLVLMATWFSVVWGLVMYFGIWRAQGMPPLVACGLSLCAGLFTYRKLKLFLRQHKVVKFQPSFDSYAAGILSTTQTDDDFCSFWLFF